MSVFVVFIFQVRCVLLGFRSNNTNIKINTVFLDVFDSGRDMTESLYLCNNRFTFTNLKPTSLGNH